MTNFSDGYNAWSLGFYTFGLIVETERWRWSCRAPISPVLHYSRPIALPPHPKTNDARVSIARVKVQSKSNQSHGIGTALLGPKDALCPLPRYCVPRPSTSTECATVGPPLWPGFGVDAKNFQSANTFKYNQ